MLPELPEAPVLPELPAALEVEDQQEVQQPAADQGPAGFWGTITNITLCCNPFGSCLQTSEQDQDDMGEGEFRLQVYLACRS